MVVHNRPGVRATTTDPVPADRPDLRHYPKRKTSVDLSEIPVADRVRFARWRDLTRPIHTRWRTTHGVCDRFGDVVTVYTGACQRHGCSGWFLVERTPAGVNARWPSYCSQACRSLALGVARRRGARRLRTGQTDGRRRPDVATFDPDDEPLPYWRALDVVQSRVTSTPTAYRQASAWLNEVETEQSRQDDEVLPNYQDYELSE